MRIVYAGESVVDQFAVWNEGGTDKITGITNFTKLSWKDGVSQIMSVTITEIGTTPGEYMMAFNPPTAGYWKVEVTVPATGDVLSSYYDVRKRTYRMRMTAVDDRTNVRFALWVENDDGTKATGFTTASATIREPDGTLVDDMGAVAPTAGGVFIFLADSADVPSGAEYIIAITATQGALTWSYNLGFSKVA